jgi:DNA-directed RNA polymerase specialized sigma24 family protein
MAKTTASMHSFPSTPWDDIDLLVQGVGEHRRRALDDLLRTYVPAMQAFLVRAMGVPAADAEDLLQGFITDKVLEQDMLAKATSERGKFRNLIRTALRNYVTAAWRRETAAKRHPGPSKLHGTDALEGHPHDSAPPDEAFESAWARAVVAQACRRMKSACQKAERTDVWGVFDARIMEPLIHNVKPTSYEELVVRFGLASPAQASNLLTTAKRSFARALRAVVSEYAGEGADVEAEIEDLLAILSDSRA